MVITGWDKSTLPQKIWNEKQAITYEGQSRDRDELWAPYNPILIMTTNIVTMTILQLKTSAFSFKT